MGDIDSSFSAGANKVQLWHGNGIKCVPASGDKQNILAKFIKNMTTQGLWYIGNYSFLCKSDMDFIFFKAKFGAEKELCIDSAYPRTCECLKILPVENDIIAKLSEYSKCIIYLPTFRKDYKNYIHPLSNRTVVEYLETNNTLWIEKPHAADKNSATVMNDLNSKYVLSLDSSFDINVILNKVDLLVTDYSSAMLDALPKEV